MPNDNGKREGGEINAGRTVTSETESYASDFPAVSPETIFELVADYHRRAVLHYLENTEDGRASFSDLAAYVSHHAYAGNSPTQIKTRLYHSALPKLAEAGLVDFDADHKTIQYLGHPLIEDCLALIDDE